MQSLNINQLVADGLAPLSYASKHLVHRLLDINISEGSSIDPLSKSSIHACFSNNNMNILLRSALTYGTASFLRTFQDLKMTYRKVLTQEINQRDKHQNTLLWYLVVAGLYSSIKELYRLASIDLDINVKNGLFNQTILHYAVIHGNFEEIRILLDLGMDTNLRDRFGRTALHYIALAGTKDQNSVEIAKLLIDHQILLNLEDYTGQTSLHLAIINENYDLVEYFVSLSNINVCIRNFQGYTPLCYLCEHILELSDTLIENNQCIDTLEHIFKIINLIIDRCSLDELFDYFHIMKNNKLGENLLLHLHDKFIDRRKPLNTGNLFHRLESIVIGTDQDHCLFVERLLKLHSWKSAIFGLCNTHDVDISNALIESIAHDPLILLTKNISPSSDLSNFFVLTFYALATNVIPLQNVVPLCKYIIKDKQTIIDQDECDLCISNYDLHTNYITFIHTCLHYASSNVFSLKHLCRCLIRQNFKCHIINKIERFSHLNLEYREYLQLNELQLIDSKIHDLSSILHLIKRLYNSESSSILFVANIDTSDDNNVINTINTIEKIMTESNVTFDAPRSTLTFSDDDEISSEQIENELANMQTKSKNIEEMIDKFLSNS